jgi:hypothetical protein
MGRPKAPGVLSRQQHELLERMANSHSLSAGLVIRERLIIAERLREAHPADRPPSAAFEIDRATHIGAPAQERPIFRPIATHLLGRNTKERL